MTVFVKRYPDESNCAAARANHTWLESLNSGVRIPRLLAAHSRHLVFEHIDGTPPAVVDLPSIAAVLGKLHSAATPALAEARLDQEFNTACGHVIADFVSVRPTIAAIPEAATAAATACVSIYKDANLRNFLITNVEVAIVDFDDLTLAPYGYDLAKLHTSMAMTFGQLDRSVATDALDHYNGALGGTKCALDDLAVWAEINWMLTADYLGRNGYRHPWPTVRPWPAPFASDRSQP